MDPALCHTYTSKVRLGHTIINLHDLFWTPTFCVYFDIALIVLK